LTIINRAAAIVVTLDSEPKQEDAMAAKSKSGKVRGVARTIAAKPPARQTRTVAPGAGAWEQIGQAPDDRDDEFDCERIVQGEGGRSLPLYSDDYN
jgi:hypothetical protein